MYKCNYVNKFFNEPVVRIIDENYYHQLSYFSEILITVRNGRPSQMIETIKSKLGMCIVPT